jgi:hypothetical protein
MTCQLDQEFVVYKANSKVATVTLPLLQDHLPLRGRATCCHQFTFCSRSPHRNVINLSLSGCLAGWSQLAVDGLDDYESTAGRIRFARRQASSNPVLTSHQRTPTGQARRPETEVGDYLRYEQRASLVPSRSLRRRTVSYDVPPARFKSKFRSGSFSVIVAARANSSLAWSRRPRLSRTSPRILGSR